MSASANTQSESTASNQTVAVVPTGIAGNPYYFQSEEQFVDEVMAELQSLATVTGSISEVIVRGSYELAEVLDEHTSDDLEVDSFSMDFRMFLDDEGNDDPSVEGVIDGGAPMAEIVADVHDLSEAEQADFDLSDRDDRDLVDIDVLNELEDRDGGVARIGSAKAKAKARATEMIVDDYYDYTETADHTLILEDGTDAYEDAARDVRGHHNWSKYPSSCDGKVRSVSLTSGEDGALNWTHALLNRNQIEEDELSDSQLQRLRATLDEGTFNALLDADYETGADDEPSEPAAEPEQRGRPAAEAAAVAGKPADD
ncbi:hypothetical protein EXE49_10670 [Halorubrum sp. ASP121]|uniref:hypothetical protein n=1 Tax=Halorubrum sp. ASP121 TaxID=1855858 RepID=UPI0010F4AC69|nr:hypothetical protein [Halorubrum sp. ASP121]TKX49540.1 hypothetical protein EXE49_10670 [Halorubrum sp. ASP121]